MNAESLSPEEELQKIYFRSFIAFPAVCTACANTRKKLLKCRVSMRTVTRKSRTLNLHKKETLSNLCQAFGKEKRAWLNKFLSWKMLTLLDNPRAIRDEAVKNQYRSSFGLQARHWKLAFEDAAGIWDKYWQALFVQVRQKINCKDFSEEEKHYGRWLLKGYKQFAALMEGHRPEPPFEIAPGSAKQVRAFVKKAIKKIRKKSPSVKKMRRVCFDANCYEVFEHNGNQYLKLMTLERGKRLILPLLGKTAISGNISIVLSGDEIFVHLSQDLKSRPRKNSAVEAVDLGYTEVMTDTAADRYGTRFGKILTSLSEKLDNKMRKRHRLHSLEKKNNKPTLRKYNLGRKKLNRQVRKGRSTLEREINHGINELLKKKKPAILITEDLRHSFTYNKPKAVNRKLSFWVRGKLQDRIEFKALAEGFRHEQVNPAYGSQTCLVCDFVDSENRKGDWFKCLHCRYEDMADRVAAVNYARRYGDQQIGRYTPYRQVKTILLERFRRRLETEQSVTVPGWTLETVAEACPPPCREQFTAEREQSRIGRSLRERNKK
jgi:putative transposase